MSAAAASSSVNLARNRALVGRLANLSVANPGSFLLLVCICVQLLGPFTAYGPIGYIDPWIYTSYFLDWPDMVSRYGDLYYGTRIPYIAAGALLFAFFSPHVANILLNVAIVWATCYGIFRLLERFYGSAPALLFSLACMAHPWLWQSAVWDYPDGPALSFLSLALWLGLAPPDWARGSAGKLLGGAMYACAGHTNMIAGFVIVPAMLGQAVADRRRGWGQVARSQLLLVAGAVVATLVLGVVSMSAGGGFWFFWPQIRQILWTSWQGGYSTWEHPISEWLPRAYRLLMPSMAAACALLLWLFRRRVPAWKEFAAPVSVVMLSSAAAFFYVGVVRNALLVEVHYHSTYILVPCFLVLGIVFSLLLRAAGLPVAAAVLACATTLGLLASYHPMHASNLKSYIWAGCVVAGLAVCAAIPVCFAPRRIPGLVAAFCLLVSMNASTMLDSRVTASLDSPVAKFSYQAILQVRRIVSLAGTSDRRVIFWFNPGEKDLHLFDSAASLYMWGFPTNRDNLLENSEWDRDVIRDHRPVFVTLSAERGVAETKRAALAGHGFLSRVMGETPVVSGPHSFWVGLLSVEGELEKP